MKHKRILHIVGARPNFMKAAPLFRVLAAKPDRFEQALVHTGQHYDAAMSDVFFRDLDIPPPDFNLEVGSGSHAQQTAQIMSKFEPVLLEYKPDWEVVPADVNSTIACALVAVKLGFRVAHVEAGLRSWDRSMPEEINRILTDQLSDLLLTPSAEAQVNLEREGIDASRIHFVGNIMIDSLVRLLPRAELNWPTLAGSLALESGGFILATLHRPSNVDDPATLLQILNALNELAASHVVLFPVHPRTRQRIAGIAGFEPRPNLRLIDPQGYMDFLALQRHAKLVVTDSGGVQEETTYLGVPCLTARPNTERPVTITHGTNSLVASETGALIEAAQGKLATRVASQPPPLWDGQTAVRIADLLQSL
jgi:UDP-N-acetylglucosamine 2-epimerase (non-hydrolysing)